jgi:hypothetical protein
MRLNPRRAPIKPWLPAKCPDCGRRTRRWGTLALCLKCKVGWQLIRDWAARRGLSPYRARQLLLQRERLPWCFQGHQVVKVREDEF